MSRLSSKLLVSLSTYIIPSGLRRPLTRGINFEFARLYDIHLRRYAIELRRRYGMKIHRLPECVCLSNHRERVFFSFSFENAFLENVGRFRVVGVLRRTVALTGGFGGQAGRPDEARAGTWNYSFHPFPYLFSGSFLVLLKPFAAIATISRMITARYSWNSTSRRCR